MLQVQVTRYLFHVQIYDHGLSSDRPARFVCGHAMGKIVHGLIAENTLALGRMENLNDLTCEDMTAVGADAGAARKTALTAAYFEGASRRFIAGRCHSGGWRLQQLLNCLCDPSRSFFLAHGITLACIAFTSLTVTASNRCESLHLLPLVSIT
jgi:hypothetical protein